MQHGNGFGLRRRRTVFSLYEASRVGCRAAAAREPPLRAAAASTEERRDEPLKARKLWSSALNDAHIIFIIAAERPAQHGLRTIRYLAARTTDACRCQACPTEPLLSIWLGRQQRPRALELALVLRPSASAPGDNDHCTTPRPSKTKVLRKLTTDCLSSD
eukprot:scaffold62808_cov32-Phaeocystis_antarctica.AAC.1